jgi:hypothetical protein
MIREVLFVVCGLLQRLQKKLLKVLGPCNKSQLL